MRQSLPVLLLRNMVLFPSTELRLEFDDLLTKQLFSLSEAYYDNEIVVVVPRDPLEEDPEVLELPELGVLAKIKLKMDMPNGKTRAILEGIKRVVICHSTKEEDLFEAEVTDVTIPPLDAVREEAYLDTLRKELDLCLHVSSYLNHANLSGLANVTSLDQFTDMIALSVLTKFPKQLTFLYEVDPTKRAEVLLQEMHNASLLMEYEQEIEKKIAKEMEKTQREYFLREKIQWIRKELGDTNDKDTEVDLLRGKIEKMSFPDAVRNRLLLELSRYESMNMNSPELGMIKNYIDWLMQLPWSKKTKDCNDLSLVKKRLDETHAGLDQVKERILEYLAVNQNTHRLRSPILCLVGPPGVGKTTLAKSIAVALGRKCTKISVGGVHDEAEVIGHRRTYIGSAPGLIIQGMKKAGTINPVFIIDEIDKMTKDIKGDPASSLLEVLDPEQNSSFVDHYIEEEYDLSKVMFITTANYLEQIPEALRDRLEIVELSSYTEYEKQEICKQHLLPKQLKEHGLKKEDIVFDDDVFLTLIRNYTKEAGVRELERMLASILRKIVKSRILTKDKSPVLIQNYNLEHYLGKSRYHFNESDTIGSIGVVNGLAYTVFGGDILPIEATFYPGKGELILTGSLGDVMKESAMISLSYIKSHADIYGIDLSKLEGKNIHIHVPEGAVPKDGPSAGVTLTTTLISLFTGKRIATTVGMTGEMTLRGKVLPIGGLKEKVIGAHRGGIRKIFIPRDNEKDLDEIPNEVKQDISFYLVDRYQDIYHALFHKNKKQAEDEKLLQLPLG